LPPGFGDKTLYVRFLDGVRKMGNGTLYIIGNGFDLHHKIKSSYTAFGEYVSAANPSLHETFEAYFSFDGNWVSLEDTLVLLCQ
jgi:hypothetical protein